MLGSPSPARAAARRWSARSTSAAACAKSWIADLTRDPGVPSQADLKWIEGEGARLLLANKVRAVINVHGGSAVAKMGARRWSRSATDNGVATYDCASLEEALEIAAEVASKTE